MIRVRPRSWPCLEWRSAPALQPPLNGAGVGAGVLAMAWDGAEQPIDRVGVAEAGAMLDAA